MKKLFLIVLILASGSLSLFAQKYEKYTNPRFFFSIDYPSDLLQMQPPSENGDGRIFVSKDGSVEMRAWANYNAMFRSVQDEARATEVDLKNLKIAYKKVSDSWFVISWFSGNKIHYRKTLYHKFKDTDVFFTFTIEYPKTQKKKFDPIVKRIEASFAFDADADV
jgi:hypothetical protein